LHVAYQVWLADPKHTKPMWRDEIIKFLQRVLRYPANIRRFLAADGVSLLLYNIAQLHAVPEDEIVPNYVRNPTVTFDPNGN